MIRTLLSSFCLAAALGAAAMAADPFRFAPLDETSLGLFEGERPVLVYNHGVRLKEGVPADRARSTYLHPVYGLDGEVITDDFPQDHHHHHGLFWAWPHVRIDGQEFDLWMYKGIEQRFVRWLDRRADAETAVLGVANGWFVGPKKVMDERVELRAHRADAEGRALDLDFTWTPTDRPVTLTGAEGKSYGGLTLRFAPGAETVITVPSGRTSDDLYMSHQPWTDLTRSWPGSKGPSGAAVFVHPSHPDFPPTWLTRHYGVLCLGWPGVQPRPFEPGVPIRCRYRVWIHRGRPHAQRISQVYDTYAKEPSSP